MESSRNIVPTDPPKLNIPSLPYSSSLVTPTMSESPPELHILKEHTAAHSLLVPQGPAEVYSPSGKPEATEDASKDSSSRVAANKISQKKGNQEPRETVPKLVINKKSFVEMALAPAAQPASKSFHGFSPVLQRGGRSSLDELSGVLQVAGTPLEVCGIVQQPAGSPNRPMDMANAKAVAVGPTFGTEKAKVAVLLPQANCMPKPIHDSFGMDKGDVITNAAPSEIQLDAVMEEAAANLLNPLVAVPPMQIASQVAEADPPQQNASHVAAADVASMIPLHAAHVHDSCHLPSSKDTAPQIPVNLRANTGCQATPDNHNGPINFFRIKHFKSSEARQTKKLIVGDEVIKEGASRWSNCLVGFFIGRRFPYHMVKNSAEKHWATRGLVEVYASKSYFLFKFRTSEQCSAVFETGPWSFAGCPIILKKWHPFINPKHLKSNRVPCWVKIFDLPIELWTENGLGMVGSMLGTLLNVDKATARRERIDAARICIEVNAEEELIKKFEVVSSLGEVEVTVEYQHLPPLCNKCKVFGHDCAELEANMAERNAQKAPSNKFTNNKTGAQNEGGWEVPKKKQNKQSNKIPQKVAPSPNCPSPSVHIGASSSLCNETPVPEGVLENEVVPEHVSAADKDPKEAAMPMDKGPLPRDKGKAPFTFNSPAQRLASSRKFISKKVQDKDKVQFAGSNRFASLQVAELLEEEVVSVDIENTVAASVCEVEASFSNQAHEGTDCQLIKHKDHEDTEKGVEGDLDPTVKDAVDGALVVAKPCAEVVIFATPVAIKAPKRKPSSGGSSSTSKKSLKKKRKGGRSS